MSSEISIRVQNLSKCYQIYESPKDRLKQFLVPKIRRALRLPVTQYFREFWALKNLSFEIKKGETVGIIGRNGSGKSTLLQIICGTLSPTIGGARGIGRIAALLELGSGFNPEFTGRENVYLNGAVLGLSNREIQEKFNEIVNFADIGEFLDQPVKTYSSGMVVRLAFAVAILSNPEILIIDEALSVGDELFQRKCFSRIEEIKKSGATILFVSHSAQTMLELCDYVMLLDQGEVIGYGRPKPVINAYHKLLYALPENRQLVRQELLQAFNFIHDPIIEVKTDKSLHAEERFDPNFVSESQMDYGTKGALIHRVGLFTLDDVPVNTLISGRRYKYSYKVNFFNQYELIRFGMLIKTISGVEMGGAVSQAGTYSLDPLFVGDKAMAIQVDFEFNCHLNEGVYFLNAGVLGLENGCEVYLHRIIDALPFRVIKDERRDSSLRNTCIVDFQATLHL